jgi:hypothetical protein
VTGQGNKNASKFYREFLVDCAKVECVVAGEKSLKIANLGLREGAVAYTPSNSGAISGAQHFCEGRDPFVAIHGPSGCGKSRILSEVMREQLLPRVLSPAHLRKETSAFHAQMPILVDDCQQVAYCPKQMVHLRVILERRLRAQLPTLLAYTDHKTAPKLGSLLPSSTRWRVESMGLRREIDKQLVLAHIAKEHGLLIRRDIIRLLSKRLAPNCRIYTGAVNRLFLYSPNWNSDESVVRACTLLQGCFEGESTDVREVALASIDRLDLERHGVNPTELLACVFQRMGLNEQLASDFLAISPAKYYRAGTKFERKKEGCSVSLSAYNLAISDIARALISGSVGSSSVRNARKIAD